MTTPSILGRAHCRLSRQRHDHVRLVRRQSLHHRSTEVLALQGEKVAALSFFAIPQPLGAAYSCRRPSEI